MPSEESQDEQVLSVIASHSDESQQIDAIANIRGWFGPELDGDSKFYPLVQNYLSDNLDVATAVSEIAKPVDAALRAHRFDKDVNIMDLWYSVLHSAKKIPYRDENGHSKLVALVKGLQEHQEKIREDDAGTYANLVNFGMASREVMNDGPGIGAGHTKPEIHAWANLNYFFARLTDEGIFGFWLYCIWAMRSALEDVLEDDEPAGIPNEKVATAAQKYAALVPAAAVWVLALGKRLYEKQEDLSPKSPSEGNPAQGGQLWEGNPEFSKSRWGFWKKRFGEVAELNGVNEETRRVAKDIFMTMQEIED